MQILPARVCYKLLQPLDFEVKAWHTMSMKKATTRPHRLDLLAARYVRYTAADKREAAREQAAERAQAREAAAYAALDALLDTI